MLSSEFMSNKSPFHVLPSRTTVTTPSQDRLGSKQTHLTNITRSCTLQTTPPRSRRWPRSLGTASTAALRSTAGGPRTGNGSRSRSLHTRTCTYRSSTAEQGPARAVSTAWLVVAAWASVLPPRAGCPWSHSPPCAGACRGAPAGRRLPRSSSSRTPRRRKSPGCPRFLPARARKTQEGGCWIDREASDYHLAACTRSSGSWWSSGSSHGWVWRPAWTPASAWWYYNRLLCACWCKWY